MNKFKVTSKIPILSRPSEYFLVTVLLLDNPGQIKIGQFYINHLLTNKNIICINSLFSTDDTNIQLKFLNLNLKYQDPISLMYGDKGTVSLSPGYELGWCKVEL